MDEQRIGGSDLGQQRAAVLARLHEQHVRFGLLDADAIVLVDWQSFLSVQRQKNFLLFGGDADLHFVAIRKNDGAVRKHVRTDRRDHHRAHRRIDDRAAGGEVVRG